MATITIEIPDNAKAIRVANAFIAVYSREFEEFLSRQDPPVEPQDATNAHKAAFIKWRTVQWYKEITVGHETDLASAAARQQKRTEVEGFDPETPAA